MSTCARQCWIFAAVMGVVVLAMSSAGGVGVLPGLFLGIVTAGLLGGLLIILFCQGADDVEEWPRPVDSARDPDAVGVMSIRRDGGPIAAAPIARPLRPQGMSGAPQGASADKAQAATFGAGQASSDSAPQPATDAARTARPRRTKPKAAGLADKAETAHSHPGGQGESA